MYNIQNKLFCENAKFEKSMASAGPSTVHMAAFPAVRHGAVHRILAYRSGIQPCLVKTDLGHQRIQCKESFLECQIPQVLLACCDSGLVYWHMMIGCD